MLQVMRRGGGLREALLSAEQDAALRAAFGRAGQGPARAAAGRIVGEHHSADRWFACDCLEPADRPPVLVPVLGAFVRRHVEGRWPEHAEWCDFFRDAAAQAAVNASYRDEAATGLVCAFADGAAAPRQVVTRSGSEHRRSRLARMLFKLLDRPGLASFQYGQRRSLRDQYGELRRAAELVPLEGDLPVSSSLCTYPPSLVEFFGRVGRMQPGRFQRSGNPHGLLIGVARSATGGVIVPTQGEPIAVAGEISIFGERDGREDGPGLAAARGPYLMICLVGRRMREADVEVLRTYLHP